MSSIIFIITGLEIDLAQHCLAAPLQAPYHSVRDAVFGQQSLVKLGYLHQLLIGGLLPDPVLFQNFTFRPDQKNSLALVLLDPRPEHLAVLNQPN